MLSEFDTLVTPEGMMRWYRTLVAQKWTYTHHRSAGRPRTIDMIVQFIVRMALDNRFWGVPLCRCQRIFGLRRTVEPPVPEHREQDITAPAIERDEGLIVAFSLANLASVVRLRDGISQRREGHEGQFAAVSLVAP